MLSLFRIIVPQLLALYTLMGVFSIYAEMPIASATVPAPVIPMDPRPDIEFNFNNASLRNITHEIEEAFNIKFLCDDALQGPGLDTRTLDETKVNFKTYKSLTKRQAWDLFNNFLKIANWAVVPTADKTIFRITALNKASRSPLPTYINCELEYLPDNETMIRYVYQLANSSADQMKQFLDKLKGQNTVIDTYQELKAIIITDTAYNVKTLMNLVQQLDRATVTQVVSVLKLQEADASEVANIITALQGKDNPAAKTNPNNKKVPSIYAVPGEVKVIVEPHSNSLILLGSSNDVARIENLIKEHIDRKLEQLYQPVHVYDLNYAPATEVANILKQVLAFGSDTAVGKAGGVRGGEKYLANINITPEPQGNRLIIRSSKQDFEHIKTVIEQLDRKQEQVAIEVLILLVTSEDIRQLGSQWRNKYAGQVNIQMSGLTQGTTSAAGVVTDPTSGLVANLISLVSGLQAGSTVVTFGQTSVWAVFAALQSLQETRVVANPFIVATNKYSSAVAVGATRRVITSQTTTTSGTGNQYDNMDAALIVQVTPQINQLGIINLDVKVQLSDFVTSPSDTSLTAGNTTDRRISTNANLADGEVLAIGGLVSRNHADIKSKIPLLGDIPIIGPLLFANRNKDTQEEMLMIFLSPKLIKNDETDARQYTAGKQQFVQQLLTSAETAVENPRDPIQRWFFKASERSDEAIIPSFLPAKPATRTLPRNTITDAMNV